MYHEKRMRIRGRKTEKLKKPTHIGLLQGTQEKAGSRQMATSRSAPFKPLVLHGPAHQVGLPVAQPIRVWTGTLWCVIDWQLSQSEAGFSLCRSVIGGQLCPAEGAEGVGTGHCLTHTKPGLPLCHTQTLALQGVWIYSNIYIRYIYVYIYLIHLCPLFHIREVALPVGTKQEAAHWSPCAVPLL